MKYNLFLYGFSRITVKKCKVAIFYYLTFFGLFGWVLKKQSIKDGSWIAVLCYKTILTGGELF